MCQANETDENTGENIHIAFDVNIFFTWPMGHHRKEKTPKWLDLRA